MPTLTVSATHNYSADVLPNGIDIIDFTAAATATFVNTQFNNTIILNNVLIDGSAGIDQLVVNGGSINALSWTFANWTAGVDTITLNGSTGADNIFGSSQADTINGSGGNDIIASGNGDDVITGGDGNDFVAGGAGNDIFVFGSLELDAGDTINGDAGTADTIRVSNFASAYLFATNATVSGIERIEFNTTSQATVDFLASQVTGITQIDGGAGTDTFQVTGGYDASGIVLTNWSASDRVRLLGTAAAETLRGTASDDFISGGDGTDLLVGNDGNDTFSYSVGLDVDSDNIQGGLGANDTIEILNTGQINFLGATISGVEAIAFRSGTSSAQFAGSVFGAGGITRVDGIAPTSFLTVSGATVDLSGVTFTNWTDLADGISITGNAAAASTLTGSAFRDSITGGGLDDIITGGLGNDNLSGGAGNDTFVYNNTTEIEATEFINGGADTDTIRIANQGAYVFDNTVTGIERLQFAQPTAFNATARFAATAFAPGGIGTIDGGVGRSDVQLLNVNTIDLSGLTLVNWGSNDGFLIEGTSGADTITGTAGIDVIQGLEGADTLSGGAGNDIFRYSSLTGISAGESINGGADIDAIEISTIAPNSPFDFSQVSISNVERLSFVAGGNVFFAGSHIGAGGIATVDGSSGNDRLTVSGSTINLGGVTFNNWTTGQDFITLNGTTGVNAIIGSNLDEVIFGSEEVDTLLGGGGNDAFLYNGIDQAQSGEFVDGGAGTNDVLLIDSLNVILDMSSLVFTGLEAVRYSGSGGGAHFLNSQIGTGANQINRVIGSTASNYFRVAGNTIDISGVAFENWSASSTVLLLGTSDANVLTGSTVADQINALAGNDVLIGGGGNDILDGGADDDFAYYGDSSNGFVAYAFATGSTVYGGTDVGTDSLNSIETIIGTQGVDVFYSDGSVNVDGGGAANYLIMNGVPSATVHLGTAAAQNIDILYTTEGSDVVDVAGNRFTFIFGLGGNDTISNGVAGGWAYGGDGNDVFTGMGAGADVFLGEAGDDRFFCGDGADVVYAGTDDDIVNGEDGDDILWGEAGDDILAGGIGSDFLIAQDGNDTLSFDEGLDIGYGGAGADRFRWTSQTQGADIVGDFSHAEGDTLRFFAQSFGVSAGLTLVDGTTFRTGAGVQATAASASFLFDTTTNILWFDADGTGAQARQAITFLSNGGGGVTASDIVFF